MTHAATSEPKGASMSGTSTYSAVRELDHRSTDGLEVTLQWHASTNVVSVAVVDTKSGEEFELVVGDGEDAFDVFHHPYAYAANRRTAHENALPVAA
jgi:hypothetical protein